jgi:sec-independent protein translocase protein TatB
MDFLGVGPMELMMIVLIAVVVIGPKDISKTARSVGRFLNKMYRSEAWKTLTEASRNLRTLPTRLAREAEIEELQGLRKDLEDTSRGISNEVRDAERGLQAAAAPIQEGVRAWTTPPAASEPPAAAPAPPPAASADPASAPPAVSADPAATPAAPTPPGSSSS